MKVYEQCGRVSLLTQSANRNSHHVTDTNRKMQDAMISILSRSHKITLFFRQEELKGIH